MNRLFSPLNDKLPVLWHGGDYNPDQWPREVWDEDMRLMSEAAVNAVSIGIFSWVKLEPSEGAYDFGWMDDLFDLLDRSDRYAILATPSAAPPAWMSRKYPEILRTGADRVRHLHGNRVNFCWTSPVYREKTRAIAHELAKRYGGHRRLLMWHVSNEYGGMCHCELCRKAFVSWLKVKFEGDLDRLNQAYWTAFWGHTFTDWDQIEIPGQPYGETAIQGLSLDWRRFTSDQIVDFFKNESGPLRETSPDVPITTNLMGTYDGFNPWDLAPHVDVISWDSYPEFVGRPIEWFDWANVAFKHDLNRSMKGKPFLMIESTPSSSNWYPAMTLKEPGRHRMEGIQALAHGSEGVMYFQWRQSRGGQEKLHGAVVGHGYTNDSRVFGEVRQTGLDLARLSEVVGTSSPTDVGLVYDWESGWALDVSCGPVQGGKGYFGAAMRFYRALWEAGAAVDVVSSSVDFSRYRALLVPMLYSLKPGVAERLREFVRSGGTLVATYMTGYVDENDLVFEKGYLAPLADVFGIRVEELDALYPEQKVGVSAVLGNASGLSGSFEASTFCERIHPMGASVEAVYEGRFHAGEAAVTSHSYGNGKAIYVGSRNDLAFHKQLLSGLARPVVNWALPEGVVVAMRASATGEFLFVTNCKNEAAGLDVEGGLTDALEGGAVGTRLELEPYGVRVFFRPTSAVVDQSRREEPVFSSL